MTPGLLSDAFRKADVFTTAAHGKAGLLPAFFLAATFLTICITQVHAQSLAKDNACVAEEDDIGILILQGLKGLADQKQAAIAAKETQAADKATDGELVKIEQALVPIEQQIKNTLGGSVGADVKFNPDDPSKFGLFRQVNEALNAFQAAVIGFKGDFLAVQGAATALEALIAGGDKLRVGAKETDDYIGWVTLAGAAAKFGVKALAKAPVAAGSARPAGFATEVLEAGAARAPVAAAPRRAGAANQAVKAGAPLVPAGVGTGRPAGFATVEGGPFARPENFATQVLDAIPGVANPLIVRPVPSLPPVIAIDQILNVLPDGQKAIRFADGGFGFFRTGEEIMSALDKGVLAAAEKAGFGAYVPGVVADTIAASVKTAAASADEGFDIAAIFNEGAQRLTIAKLNEEVIVQTMKYLGFVDDLPANIPDKAFTLLANIKIAIGRGAKTDLKSNVDALVQATRGYYGSFEDFLSAATKAFERSPDGPGVVQMFTQSEIELLQAAYVSSGNVQQIENLIGAVQTAAMRGVTAEQFAQEALAVAAASQRAAERAKVAAARAAALDAVNSGLTVASRTARSAGQAASAIVEQASPGGAPAASQQSVAGVSRRQLLENTVLAANPIIQAAGGIELALQRFDALRRINNHSFTRFARDTAVQYLMNPLEAVTDLIAGNVALDAWKDIVDGKAAEISGMQRNFGQSIASLRQLQQVLQQADVDNADGLFGADGLGRIEQMIKDLDAAYAGASSGFRAGQADRFRNLRERLIRQRNDLLAAGARLRQLQGLLPDAIGTLDKTRIGFDGKPRLGISFLDPLVFLQLSKVEARVSAFANAATLQTDGKLVETMMKIGGDGAPRVERRVISVDGAETTPAANQPIKVTHTVDKSGAAKAGDGAKPQQSGASAPAGKPADGKPVQTSSTATFVVPDASGSAGATHTVTVSFPLDFSAFAAPRTSADVPLTVVFYPFPSGAEGKPVTAPLVAFKAPSPDLPDGERTDAQTNDGADQGLLRCEWRSENTCSLVLPAGSPAAEGVRQLAAAAAPVFWPGNGAQPNIEATLNIIRQPSQSMIVSGADVERLTGLLGSSGAAAPTVEPFVVGADTFARVTTKGSPQGELAQRAKDASIASVDDPCRQPQRIKLRNDRVSRGMEATSAP